MTKTFRRSTLTLLAAVAMTVPSIVVAPAASAASRLFIYLGCYAVGYEYSTYTKVTNTAPYCTSVQAKTYEYLGGGISDYTLGSWSSGSSYAWPDSGWQYSGGAARLYYQGSTSEWGDI